MADAFLGHQEVDKKPLQKRDSGYLSPGITPGGTPEGSISSKAKSLHLEVKPTRSTSSPAAIVSQESCSEMPVPQHSRERQQQQQQLPVSRAAMLKKNHLVKQHSLPESSPNEVSKDRSS